MAAKGRASGAQYIVDSGREGGHRNILANDPKETSASGALWERQEPSTQFCRLSSLISICRNGRLLCCLGSILLMPWRCVDPDLLRPSRPRRHFDRFAARDFSKLPGGAARPWT